MAETTVRAIIPSQQVTYYLLGLFVDPGVQASYPGPPFLTSVQGQRYQFNTTTTDRPRVCSLQLLLVVTQAVGPAVALGGVEVALQNQANAPVFSNPGNLPTNPGVLDAGWISYGSDDGTGWSQGVPPASIFIDLGTAMVDVVNGTTHYDISDQSSIIEDYNADGFMNLSVYIYTGNGTVNVSPALLVTEYPAFTGVDGHGVDRGRPVRDMKTGLPTHVDQLVEDGYHPGVWTAGGQWDPPDPRDERPTPMPPDEGAWEDDVPAS